MKFKDHIDIILSLVSKVDYFWNLFFISNLGIISWFFSKSNSLPVSYTIIASIIYFFFLLLNCIAHIRAYTFLNLAIEEMKLNLSNYNILSTNLKTSLNKLSYNNRIWITALAYLFILMITLTVFWIKHYELI